MIGLTDYITECSWTDIYTVWYIVVDDAYQQFTQALGRRLRRRGPEPTFSDSEVITVALIIETFFQGNEEMGLAFLRQYHLDLFPQLLDNGRFNRRRRQLVMVIEALRRQVTNCLIDPNDPVRIVDSAPIPACTYTRNSRCQTVVGPEYMGVVVSKRVKLFGHRFFATTTLDQVIDQWMLAPAAPNDGKMMPSFFEDQHNLWVLADNAFHVPGEIDLLHKSRNIQVVAALQKDAVKPLPSSIRRLFNRLRRRIETAFSVLTTVFSLETPGSRSLDGLLARVATSVLAYNLSFLMCAELNSL